MGPIVSTGNTLDFSLKVVLIHFKVQNSNGILFILEMVAFKI